MRGVTSQLYADHLKCSSHFANDLSSAIRFTTAHVRVVVQEVSPGKCAFIMSALPKQSARR